MAVFIRSIVGRGNSCRLDIFSIVSLCREAQILIVCNVV